MNCLVLAIDTHSVKCFGFSCVLRQTCARMEVRGRLRGFAVCVCVCNHWVVWVFAGDNAGSHIQRSCGGAAEAVSDGVTVDPETAGPDRCQKHTPSPPARQRQGTVVPHTVGPLLLLLYIYIYIFTSYDKILLLI